MALTARILRVDGVASAETSEVICLNLCWGEHTLPNVNRARTTKLHNKIPLGITLRLTAVVHESGHQSESQ